MDKYSLLKSLAEKGYNIGFGARKTFLSYGIYSKIPRFLSLCTVFVGVYQMTTRYKNLNPGTQEIVSVIIICIGILALILDAGSKDKEHYNQVGKQLASLYNELQTMYNTVKNMDDHADFSPFEKRMKEIEAEVHRIAISTKCHLPIFLPTFTFSMVAPKLIGLMSSYTSPSRINFHFYTTKQSSYMG
ncbi:hypothetical protein Desca_1620 [Desulfotomaculum nigrificans CO-1-SRB]|uniref:SMODS and SLOG-associating 2TM effector domain-containing protein n=2 Tax=Eubacteriales TaxID=186802 RepID=K8DWQ3_9FIRM|nr:MULTISPECIES: SLATT domain-containing protein [Eubacteriales]AEF94469.1 hypothetical protein Desca_1620 [Desulfotomaculum nigrificans CO-1-SRB]CCO06857.1 conserved hypothetical protein [Desulforamulus hydrothermalis Lam5 = DSM 18033]SHH44260.1 hypothetical protein SAMN02745177_02564 [Desulforamulus hydrothermalis Lam5 = DSM 18033]